MSVNVKVQLTDVYCRRSERGCGEISWHDAKSLVEKYVHDDDPRGGSSTCLGYYVTCPTCGKQAGGVTRVPTIAKVVAFSTANLEMSES